MDQRLLWEQHCCLPLVPTADLDELTRYARPGGAYVSVNVGFSPHSTELVFELLHTWRRGVTGHDRLTLVDGVADIEAATRAGQVGVAFDLEDSGPLGGRLERVKEFYDLGVRTLLPTYNLRNAAGSGCMDAVDEGLTAYGRDLVREMNAVGMVVDGSHCSTRTGLDLAEVTQAPMVYSHSCMRALWEHERNITDDQARACAETGGVVGITGVGVFLGPNDASVEAFVRHVDYAVDLIGPEHVGISSDYSFDLEDLNREMMASPELFPEPYTRWGPIKIMPPEDLLRVEQALLDRGYPTESVTGILGGNFRRVAEQVWKPVS